MATLTKVVNFKQILEYYSRKNITDTEEMFKNVGVYLGVSISLPYIHKKII